MINLLPLRKKQEIAEEKKIKIALTLSVNFLAILICFCLVLYLISIFIFSKIEFQEIIYLEKEREINSLKMQQLNQDLKSFNQIFARLDSFYQNKFQTTENLKKISEYIPEGIYLTSLSINPNKEKKQAEIVLNGFSLNTEILLNFRKKLEENEYFKEIYIPPSVWLQQANINFTASFKISL